jgi:ABC-type microcin C transport system duplicated ATPase subunit YejF
MAANLLEVHSLTKHFPVKRWLLRRQPLGYVKAVDGVDFAIDQGETFGLVGESGCGKTTVANVILLLHSPTRGEVRFQGLALTRISPDELRAYRRAVQAVFQDPYGALNPRLRVGEIVEEPLLAHGYHRGDRQARVREALQAGGCPTTARASFPMNSAAASGNASVLPGPSLWSRRWSPCMSRSPRWMFPSARKSSIF